MTDQPPLLPLAVTMGDPAGCGPQITSLAWQALRASDVAPFYVIGNPSLFTGPVTKISDPSEAAAAFTNSLPVLDTSTRLGPVETGTPDPKTAPAILESIELATTHALEGKAGGVVTNPISKAVLYSAGFAYPGHTEFLAALCERATGEASPPVMMLVGGGLRVSLVTIHIPLLAIPALLTEDLIRSVVETTASALQRDFGLTRPRIALTGLNPHAGESGTIGTEERDIINPAALSLRADGLDVTDARPADTVFAEMLDGRFDAVVAMTHDQGLIPVKTLDMWGGVNTTLGLPIIRTSPDHGTAYDAARDGVARPDSLIAAIRLASQMAANRARA
ncbi:4-hydroxythreonine-4-phosphate dehydrogenase PdxA [Henriciella litoralis]|uniref:4-hydroxythreonine-4-phosphate dehydrogenase PdxA n=1 Tax=Henriciella litoralis TaxID=568102 RepID=UPI000A00D8CB|nr:4-hydroxythreonine-4-phosphate dehydrogenase PdxA [Henriciella litoralis]